MTHTPDLSSDQKSSCAIPNTEYFLANVINLVECVSPCIEKIKDSISAPLNNEEISPKTEIYLFKKS